MSGGGHLPAILEVFREREAAWREHANCHGIPPAFFFAERGDTVAEAKEVCLGCDVRRTGLRARSVGAMR